MLEKIKNALFRFMNGRYGTDALNNFLLFASLAVLLVNTLTFKSVFLGLLGDVLIFASLFRTLSRNLWKRRKENIKGPEHTGVKIGIQFYNQAKGEFEFRPGAVRCLR